MSLAVLVGGVIACLLIGATFAEGSSERETIKGLTGVLTFLAAGLGVWVLIRERPPK